jgi:hypothetical protein
VRERNQKRLCDDLVLVGIWAEIEFSFRGSRSICYYSRVGLCIK